MPQSDPVRVKQIDVVKNDIEIMKSKIESLRLGIEELKNEIKKLNENNTKPEVRESEGGWWW